MHPCPFTDCDYSAKEYFNLQPHLVSIHSWTKVQWEDLKRSRAEEREAAKKLSQSAKPQECLHCDDRFKDTKQLNQHIRRKHPDEDLPNYNTVYCPLDTCDSPKFRSREDLALHCAEKHASEDSPFDIEELYVNSIEEFKEWKRQLENSTRCLFTAESKRGKSTYYWCSRSNRDRRDPGSDKPDKSKKAIRYCPAFLNIRTNDVGSSLVRYCRDHFGHETKLTNAKFQLHSNDHQSVIERFQSGNETGIRLAHYDPAATNSTQFVVITDEQVEWLRKYGGRCIIIDDTFRTTRHSIRLLTFLVLDEYDRGLPAAHLLAYHISEAEVAVLFKEVLKLIPTFDPQYFMSDAAGALYNGFTRALPHSQATRLICLWHFKKFIREQIVFKYRDDKERGNVIYATIQRLCGIIDRKEFNLELNSLMSSLNDTEGEGFLQYFRPWARDRAVWAAYNRRDSPVNTSMMSEAYHKVLKTKWIPKRGNARVDELVHTLLWVPGDIEEEHEIEDDQGLFEGKYRLMENYKRHRSAISAYKDEIEKMERTTKTTWTVKSEKGDSIYTVTDKGSAKCDCEESNLHCYGCASCPRRFDCSCPDGRKSGISCKHVHACLLYSSNQDPDTLPAVPPTIQQQRVEEIDMTHDYTRPNDPMDVDLQPMDEEVDDEEWRERQDREVKTAQWYAEAYKLLNEGKRRIELTKKNNRYERLECFVERMKEALEDLDELDGRGNAPRPNSARGHVKFVPAQIGQRGRPRNAIDTSSQPLPVLHPDEMQTCNRCLLRVAPRRGARSQRENGNGMEMESDNEEDQWSQCDKCNIWTHDVCCAPGSLCLSCWDGIVGGNE